MEALLGSTSYPAIMSPHEDRHGASPRTTLHTADEGQARSWEDGPDVCSWDETMDLEREDRSQPAADYSAFSN